MKHDNALKGDLFASDVDFAGKKYSGKSDLKLFTYSLGNEDKALALPDKLQESLASLSCDLQQIVSLFKENQSLMEASLQQPDYQSMKWIRCLSRKANIAKRLDVVKHLRSISLAGTVGEQSVVYLCNTVDHFPANLVFFQREHFTVFFFFFFIEMKSKLFHI